MTIYCKICNCALKSLGPAPEAQHIMASMASHLTNRHPHEAQALKEDIRVLFLMLNGYMLTRHVRIPPEETELLKLVKDAEAALMHLFVDVTPVA